MEKWEYMVIELIRELEDAKKQLKGLPKRWFKSPYLEDLLNKYVSQGWELVSFEPVIIEEEKDFIAFGVFKRRKK